jgi:LemA protein
VDIAAAVVIALVLLTAAGLAVSYNRFVTQRAAVAASWAGIDAELQRRHDLVPNLVETVRGYAAHERRTLEAVTQARAQAIAATSDEVPREDQARAEDALTEGLTSLLALSEAFPDLRADGPFRELQRQLIETEDRISAARRLYNLEVAAYERRRAAVPSNLVASTFGFPREPMFEIQDAAAVHARQVQA